MKDFLIFEILKFLEDICYRKSLFFFRLKNRWEVEHDLREEKVDLDLRDYI